MVKRVLLCAVILMGFMSVPRVAMAGCGGDLLDCYAAAAAIDNFWYRSAAGLDCELQYAGCIRQVLVGY
jgi:hypothetical protein